MIGSPDRPFEYSPDLLAMTVNGDGEHRIVRLYRSGGRREVVSASQTAEETALETQRLREEAHTASLNDPSSRLFDQPRVTYYAYNPDGTSIDPSSILQKPAGQQSKDVTAV